MLLDGRTMNRQQWTRITNMAYFLCLPIKDALPCKDVSGKTYEEDFEDRLQSTSAQ